MIRVKRPDGTEREGAVMPGAREETWGFVPARPWRAGGPHLVVPTTIEDLAGSHVGQAFDVVVVEEGDRRIETPTVEVAITVK